MIDASTTYAVSGYRLASDLFGDNDFAELKRDFLDAAERMTGLQVDSMHDDGLTRLLTDDLPLEARLYDATKSFPSLRALAFHPQLVKAVGEIIDLPFGVFEKAVLRIDLPGVENEVTGWHQDHHFVRGNTDIVTSWIPLQDVDLVNGCLLVCAGSQQLGPVEHPQRLGKRDCLADSSVAAFEQRPMMMTLGSALLFHACLFHTGQLNRSAATRYSVQYRYTPLGLPTDPSMGTVLPVRTA